MKKIFIWKKVVIHSVVWIILFMLNYLIVRNYPVLFKTWFHVKVWMIYILIFYINYLLLIPYFLFKKKYIVYVIAGLIMLSALTYIKDKFQKEYFVEARTHELKILRPPPSAGYPHGEGFPRKVRIRKPFLPMGREFYGLLLIFAISTSVRLVAKWQDAETKRNETEKQKLFAELSYLKKQVNPHFLFNALNNVYSLSLSKSDQTTTAILKLSYILRYMLYGTNTIQSIKNEIEVVKNYIDLQKFSLTEKVTLKFTITGESDEYLIEPLLLLPIIENAFKFGVDNATDSFIEIEIKIKDGNLYFTTKNKIVNKPVINNENFGIGINNIKRRLELLYPSEHEFTCGEKDGVFSVYLFLMLKK